MLACTEMITMCLQSAKQKHLRAQQQQQPLHTTGQGLTIFHDVSAPTPFTHNDGKLSFDEFNAYFADGILTTEELQELFYSIDGRQNNNLDTDKLSGWWESDLREAKEPELTAVQRNGRRCGRRVHNNLCMSPSDPCSGILTTGVSMEDDENWCSQINRLQQLLDKLECQNILLVQRQMSVTDENLDNFRKVLKGYIDATSAHSDNLHYLQSNDSKDFQRCIIDMLEDSEVVSTMLLPGLYMCV
ncbi:N-terminal EF-hand calcium-binding protein 1 [Nibea albiflora]|uniref:N-terminal EF-hand calcium-binding protein 1 n=1 Tax=Nibea albiflora TaxID=240163 RepID=A0ACB7F132_NIBAL|nr:N-terminal EF-hand calcium-binding protein 1 [Nibea albiflora]